VLSESYESIACLIERSRYATSISQGTQILGREKAEASGRAEGASSLIFPLRSDRLGCILDYGKSPFLAYLAKDMYRHHGRDSSPESLVNYPTLGYHAVVCQPCGEGGGIHVECIRQNVYKGGDSTCSDDGSGRSEKGEGGSDGDVSLLQTDCLQGKDKSIGSRCTSNCSIRTAVFGEFRFELLEFRALYET